MDLLVLPDGTGCCIYDVQLDLRQLGDVSIRRASHVEPVGDHWQADLSPVGGPLLGPYQRRSEALAAEYRWLIEHLAQLALGQVGSVACPGMSTVA